MLPHNIDEWPKEAQMNPCLISYWNLLINGGFGSGAKVTLQISNCLNVALYDKTNTASGFGASFDNNSNTAAQRAFDNFKKSFPDSKYLEELAYLKVVAEHKFATQSFQQLQLERYTLVVQFYQELVDNFPNSTFVKEAEKMYTDSLTQIAKLKPLKTNKNS